jgi:hypothetical protein
MSLIIVVSIGCALGGLLSFIGGAIQGSEVKILYGIGFIAFAIFVQTDKHFEEWRIKNANR